MFAHGAQVGPALEHTPTSTHDDEEFIGIMQELAMRDADEGKIGLDSAFTSGMTLLLAGNARPFYLAIAEDDGVDD